MTDADAEAIQAQQSYQAKCQQIERDPNLTNAGKTAALAELYTAHEDRIAKLRESKGVTQGVTEQQIQQLLFGERRPVVGADAISQRDAFARAAQIKTPDEAFALLQQAEWSNDAVLERAIARFCYEQSRGAIGHSDWTRLVDMYAAGQGAGMQEKVQELREIQRASRRRNMRDSVVYSVAKPELLKGLTPDQMRELAAQKAGR